MTKKAHFIGIGGSGISAIARMLLERGWQVSGTDIHSSPYFEALSALGANTRLGHHPELALQSDLVIRSSAVKDDDLEVRAAQAIGHPVLKRSEFLPQLTEGSSTLAVAGSHGKTTTSAILVHLLQAANLDPSFILGSEIKNLHSNAHSGKDKLFIIEADEYDYMFLGLNPFVSVVTNIEYDHPDFFRTPEIYTQAFVDFINKTEKDGTILLGGDDLGIQGMLKNHSFPNNQLLTYGFEDGNDYQITGYLVENGIQTFYLSTPEKRSFGPFKINQPGKFNVANSAAALAVVNLLNLDLANLTNALISFEGTSRRFDLLAENENVKIFNDYGHHPSQLLQTIEAARQKYSEAKIWAIWEPHTVSRTERLQHEFSNALKTADHSIILKLFGAREEDSSFNPSQIAEEVNDENCLYISDYNDAVEYISTHLTGNDLMIVFSAGKGPEFAQLLCDELKLESKND